MNRSLSFNKLINLAAQAGLIVRAAISLRRFFQETFSRESGKDMHTYRYADHYKKRKRILHNVNE